MAELPDEPRSPMTPQPRTRPGSGRLCPRTSATLATRRPRRRAPARQRRRKPAGTVSSKSRASARRPRRSMAATARRVDADPLFDAGVDALLVTMGGPRLRFADSSSAVLPSISPWAAPSSRIRVQALFQPSGCLRVSAASTLGKSRGFSHRANRRPGLTYRKVFPPISPRYASRLDIECRSSNLLPRSPAVVPRRHRLVDGRRAHVSTQTSRMGGR